MLLYSYSIRYTVEPHVPTALYTAHAHIITYHQTHQSLSFKGDHREPQDLRRRTEIKPLALTNGHGRYITVTPERTLVSVGEWPLHITVINL
jgi:hypothetical protein